MTTVVFPPEYFEQAHPAAIYFAEDSAASVNACGAAPPTDKTPGVLGAGADMTAAWVPCLMYVPQPYIHLHGLYGRCHGRRISSPHS